MDARAFIDQSRQLLTDSYVPRIGVAIDGLSVDNLWWRANEQSNSIGNLMLHLSGNARQWIVSGVGGSPDIRERTHEFSERRPLNGDELISHLGATVREVDAVLAALDPARLQMWKGDLGLYDLSGGAPRPTWRGGVAGH
jgi:hypothetical protein